MFAWTRPNVNGGEMWNGTILAFPFTQGLILASDSRSSLGGDADSRSPSNDDDEDNLRVVSDDELKVKVVKGNLVAAGVGSTSACKECLDQLSWLASHASDSQTPVSASVASESLRGWMQNCMSGRPVSVRIMVAGFDELVQSVYVVEKDERNNTITRNKFNTVVSRGTGSQFAQDELTDGHCFQMELKEAEKLAKRAIYKAIGGDLCTGGDARVYHIDVNGCSEMSATSYRELCRGFGQAEFFSF